MVVDCVVFVGCYLGAIAHSQVCDNWSLFIRTVGRLSVHSCFNTERHPLPRYIAGFWTTVLKVKVH